MNRLSITKTNNSLRVTLRRRSRLVIAKASRGPQGSSGQNTSGGGAGRYKVCWTARTRMRSDRSWMTWGTQGFSDNTIDDSSGGKGAEPNVQWNALGIIANTGNRLVGYNIVGRTNNNLVDGLDVRIYEQYGDFVAGYNTFSATTRNLIYSVDGLDMKFQKKHGHFIPLDHTFAQDCEVFIYMRPTNVHTADRFLYATYSLDFESL